MIWYFKISINVVTVLDTCPILVQFIITSTIIILPYSLSIIANFLISIIINFKQLDTFYPSYIKQLIKFIILDFIFAVLNPSALSTKVISCVQFQITIGNVKCESFLLRFLSRILIEIHSLQK